jgi:hypothetical protein
MAVKAYQNLLLNGHHAETKLYNHIQVQLDELAYEINKFDTNFAWELRNRLKQLIDLRVSQNVPTSVYACLSMPPRINIEDVFTEEDIIKVEDILKTYPPELIVGDKHIPISYISDYNKKARLEIDISDISIVELPDISNWQWEIVLLKEGKAISQYTYSSKQSAIDATERYLESIYQRQIKEQNERLDNSAIEAGNPTDFGGRTRLAMVSYSQGFWVIKADGSLRPPDIENRYESVWRVIRDGEIAIRLTHDTSDPMVGECEVVHCLIDKPTQEQIVAVRQIEQQRRLAEGAWAIDSKDKEKKKLILDAIAQNDWLRSLIASHKSPNSVYNELISNTGFVVHNRFDYKTVPADEDFIYTADGRQAAEMEVIQITDENAIQVLAFYKYGFWNMALKVIEHTQVVATEAKSSQSAITADMLKQLADKFNS